MGSIAKEKRERFKTLTTYTVGSLKDNVQYIPKRASMKKFSKDFQTNTPKTAMSNRRETTSQKKLVSNTRDFERTGCKNDKNENQSVSKHTNNNSYSNHQQKNKSRTSKTPRVHTNQFSKILSHISYHGKKDSSQINALNTNTKKMTGNLKDFKSCNNLNIIHELSGNNKDNKGLINNCNTNSATIFSNFLNTDVIHHNSVIPKSKKNDENSQNTNLNNFNYSINTHNTNRNAHAKKNMMKYKSNAKSSEKDLKINTAMNTNQLSIDFMPDKSALTPKYNALSAKNLSKKNVNMFRSVNKELMNKKVGKDLSLKMDRLLR